MIPKFWGFNLSIYLYSFFLISLGIATMWKNILNLPSFQQKMYSQQHFPKEFFLQCHYTTQIRNSPRIWQKINLHTLHRTPSHRSFRVSSDPASFHGTGRCKHSFAPRVSPCLGGFMTTLKSHPCSFQVLHKLSTCGELWIWSKDSAKAPKKQPDWLLVWGCYVGGFAILWILVNFVGLKNSTFYLKGSALPCEHVTILHHQHPKSTTSYNIWWPQRISLEKTKKTGPNKSLGASKP